MLRVVVLGWHCGSAMPGCVSVDPQLHVCIIAAVMCQHTVYGEHCGRQPWLLRAVICVITSFLGSACMLALSRTQATSLRH